ncbi:hypothetical protein BGX26_010567 [Mortierella sp. AD094]|nr:hypothetical protein BGX26_010567 [Mortierella sp. AD094]
MSKFPLRYRNRPHIIALEHDHGVDPDYFSTIQGTNFAEPPSFPQPIQPQADLDTYPIHSLPISEAVDFAESIPLIQSVRCPSRGGFKTLFKTLFKILFKTLFKTLFKMLFKALFIAPSKMTAQAFTDLYSLWIPQLPQKNITKLRLCRTVASWFCSPLLNYVPLGSWFFMFTKSF